MGLLQASRANRIRLQSRLHYRPGRRRGRASRSCPRRWRALHCHLVGASRPARSVECESSLTWPRSSPVRTTCQDADRRFNSTTSRVHPEFQFGGTFPPFESIELRGARGEAKRLVGAVAPHEGSCRGIGSGARIGSDACFAAPRPFDRVPLRDMKSHSDRARRKQLAWSRALRAAAGHTGQGSA